MGGVFAVPERIRHPFLTSKTGEPQTEANCPEKVPTYQPSSQPTRGIGDLEVVPDTRSGGSVLEAPPGAEEGALPRERCPVCHSLVNAFRKRNAPPATHGS